MSRVARFEFAAEPEGAVVADGCTFGRGLTVLVDRSTGTPKLYSTLSALAMEQPRGDVRWLDLDDVEPLAAPTPGRGHAVRVEGGDASAGR